MATAVRIGRFSVERGRVTTNFTWIVGSNNSIIGLHHHPAHHQQPKTIFHLEHLLLRYRVFKWSTYVFTRT